MAMSDLKMKISAEADSRGAQVVSKELSAGAGTDPELQRYAADLAALSSATELVNWELHADLAWETIEEKIRDAMDDNATKTPDESDALLSPPLPETKEEAAGAPAAVTGGAPPPPAAETPPEKPAVPDVKKAFTGGEPAQDEEIVRLSVKPRAASTSSDGSSGLINFAALVEEHRRSQLPPAPAGEPAQARAGGVIAPAPARKAGGAMVAVAAAAIVLVALAGVGIVWKTGLLGTKAKEAPLGGPAGEASRQAAAAESTVETIRPPAPTIASLPPRAGESQQAPAQGEPSSKHAAKKKGGGGAKSADGAGTGGAAANAAETAAAAKTATTATKAAEPSKTSGKDDLLSLLDSATEKKEKPAAAGAEPKTTQKAPGTASADEIAAGTKTTETKAAAQPAEGGPVLPATLSKEQIKTVMRTINAKAMKCGEGKVGTLTLSLVVAGDGSVKSVKSSGALATDPAGKCVENLAAKLKFPPFKNATANVTYPFVFAPPAGE